MSNVLILLLAFTLLLPVHGQQPSVLIGAEKLDSRKEAGLRGLVRSVLTYDDRGNLKKEAHYNEKNVYSWAHSYSYKFDNRGNWIERKDMYSQPDREAKPDERAWMMTYRVITYYRQDQIVDANGRANKPSEADESRSFE